jgi:hypothetical protein
MENIPWLNVAALIAQLLIGAWHVRVMRQTANPAMPPPQTLRTVAAKIIGVVKKFWAVGAGVALSLAGILWEVSRSGRADGVSTFFIVLFTVALSFHLSALVSMRNYDELSARTFDLMGLVRGIQDFDKSQIDVNKMVLDLQAQILELKKQLHEPKKTRPPKKLKP